MKVTSFELFLVPPRWMFCASRPTRASPAGASRSSRPRRAGPAAVEVLGHTSSVRTPCASSDHWQVLTKGGFYRGGPVLSSAVAGIDQALWDIAGKTHGCPCTSCWAAPYGTGCASTPGWTATDRRLPLAEESRTRRRSHAGFTAVKMNASAGCSSAIHPARGRRRSPHRVAAVRQAVGPDSTSRGLCTAGSRPHGQAACCRARAVPPAVRRGAGPPRARPHVSQVAQSTSIPLATGERLYSRWDFEEVLR